MAICAWANVLSNAQVLAGKGTSKPLSSTLTIGLGATDLAQAYNLTNTLQANGTIAIVDAAAFPSAAADLAGSRSLIWWAASVFRAGIYRALQSTELMVLDLPSDAVVETVVS